MYVAAAHATLQTPLSELEAALCPGCGVGVLASRGDVELSGVRDSDLCHKLKPVGVIAVLLAVKDDVSLAPSEVVMKCLFSEKSFVHAIKVTS